MCYFAIVFSAEMKTEKVKTYIVFCILSNIPRAFRLTFSTNELLVIIVRFQPLIYF